MAQAATVKTPAAPRRRGVSGGAPPRLHAGRLAFLALVLIAAALYVQPLRAFFAQQDRYQRESASLRAAREDNATYKRQIERLTTASYVAERARVDLMLVPRETQVFVIKGLPGERAEAAAEAQRRRQPTGSSFSVLDRLDDLWHTLLN